MLFNWTQYVLFLVVQYGLPVYVSICYTLAIKKKLPLGFFSTNTITFSREQLFNPMNQQAVCTCLREVKILAEIWSRSRPLTDFLTTFLYKACLIKPQSLSKALWRSVIKGRPISLLFFYQVVVRAQNTALARCDLSWRHLHLRRSSSLLFLHMLSISLDLLKKAYYWVCMLFWTAVGNLYITYKEAK